MTILALLLAVQAVHVEAPPTLTVAITLSAVSIVAVGTLIFKAGEWRGEHRALQERVNDGYAALEQRMEEGFSRIERDIRELRKH